MSELQAYNSGRIYCAVEQVEQEAGDIEDLHLDDNLFYIKSEVDKEIDRLKKQSSCKFGDDCLRVRQAERELRHNKYKQCIDKASYWLAVSYQCVDGKHKQRAERHRHKWLELAREFKETK